MNIFILDYSPVKAAEYHCDKHVVKMVVESCQILSSAAHLRGAASTPYKPCFLHHPCVKWAAESQANYVWLLALTKELSYQYFLRYQKSHACYEIFRELVRYVAQFPQVGLTPFALAMPEKFKQIKEPVLAYRQYYIHEKAKFAKWKLGAPDWWTNVI